MPGKKSGIEIHHINTYGFHKLELNRFKDKNVNKI